MGLKNIQVDKIKRIVFDLDDTLFDTYNLLIATATREACTAMIKAGLNTNLQEALGLRQKLIDTREKADLFKKIVEFFGVRDGCDDTLVSKAGFDAFHAREIKEKIVPFPEVPKLLRELKEKFELFLVTLGSLKTQKRKVELLNLQSYFKEIIYVEISKEKNKKAALKSILKREPLIKPEAHLSVGNRIDSEIRDAKELGMQTLLIAHGEHSTLLPKDNFEIPDLQIEKIQILAEILK